MSSISPYSVVATRTRVTLLAAVLLLGCKKEGPEPALPPATQSGLNTAGCKVDGKTWIAYQADIFGGSATTASWLRLGSTGRFVLSIRLKRNDDQDQVHSQTSVGLYVPDIRRAGTFALDQRADLSLANSNPAYASFAFGKPTPDQVYLTGPSAPGLLVITRFDTVARVVAGTYEFSALERAGGEPVRVTEGRFDLKF